MFSYWQINDFIKAILSGYNQRLAILSLPHAKIKYG